MRIIKNLKSDALMVLRGNWIKVIGITLIWGLIFLMSAIVEMLITFILEIPYYSIKDKILYGNIEFLFPSSEVLIFITIFLLVVLIFGLLLSVLLLGDVLWNYKLISQKNEELCDVFYYYSNFKLMCKSWYISFQIAFRKLFWGIIIFLPSIVVGAWTLNAEFSNSNVCDYILISFGYILTSCLLIVQTIICIVFFRRYFLTRYLIVSGQCGKVRDAINMSIKIMQGNKMDCLLVFVSFLGWILLCILVIPIFFVFPYIKSTICLYAKYLVEDYSVKNKKNIPEERLEDVRTFEME